MIFKYQTNLKYFISKEIFYLQVLILKHHEENVTSKET